MPFSNEPSPLGNFSFLAKEIRLMIWKQLLPESRSSSPSCPKQSHLAILATSHALSHEVQTDLYRTRIITFDISPNPVFPPRQSKPILPSTLAISDQHGCTWSVHPRYQTEYDRQFDDARPWYHLPYQELKAIRFALTAPNPSDPGQLLQLRNKLCWALALLQQRGRPWPPIQISILDTPSRPWCTATASADGKAVPHHSLPTSPTALQHRSSDLDILLSAFHSQPSPAQLAISLPPSITPHHHPLIAEIIHSSSGEKDTWTLHLDHLLDHLPGPTARSLRLERFSTWSPAYEQRINTLLHPRTPTTPALLLSDTELTAATHAFKARAQAQWVYRPVSVSGAAVGVGVEVGDGLWIEGEKMEDVAGAVDERTRAGWVWEQREWWRVYWVGIPRWAVVEEEVRWWWRRVERRRRLGRELGSEVCW